MNKKLKKQIQAWHEASEHQTIIDTLTAIELDELGVEERGWLARAYNNIEDYESALIHLLAIEEESIDDPLWHYRIGYAYFYLNQEREAQKCFERALELNPNQADCRMFIKECMRIRTLWLRIKELCNWLGEYDRELSGGCSEAEQKSLWREAADIIYPGIDYRVVENRLELLPASAAMAQSLSRALVEGITLTEDCKWQISCPIQPIADTFYEVTPGLIAELSQIGVSRATLDIRLESSPEIEVIVPKLIDFIREEGQKQCLCSILSVTGVEKEHLTRIELELYHRYGLNYLTAVFFNNQEDFPLPDLENGITLTTRLYTEDDIEQDTLFPADYEGSQDDDQDELIPEYIYSEEEMDALEAHIDKHFGKSEHVFHEVVSPDIHLDLYIIEPTDERPYYTIVTGGMGAYEMNVPDELIDAQLQRAELVICLPKDWPLRSQEEQDYWPLRLIKTMGRLPIYNNTWLGWGHSVTHEEPYDSSVGFTGCMLVNPAAFGEASVCVLPSGDEVNFYQIIPLYEAEMQYKIKHGAEALLELMNQVSHVLDPQRPCVVDKDRKPLNGEKQVFS